MGNQLEGLKEALEALRTTSYGDVWDSSLVEDNGEQYHAVTNADDVIVRANDAGRHSSWLCDYLEAVSPANIAKVIAAFEDKDRRIADLESDKDTWQATSLAMRDCWREEKAELEYRLKPPFIPAQGSKEVNDAAWKLHDTLTDYGPLNGHQFNNLKGCFYAALKTCMEAAQVSQPPIRQQHAEWSDATFGNVGPVGPLKHLSKEALEAAADPQDLSEWADMKFLFWDAQRRAGITDEQINKAMIEKLEINKARSWPAPKDGEPRLHIKSDGE